MPKTIYDLELYEVLEIRSTTSNSKEIKTTMTRVPGGWVYRTLHIDGLRSASSESSVFIPYNDEYSVQRTFKDSPSTENDLA